MQCQDCPRLRRVEKKFRNCCQDFGLKMSAVSVHRLLVELLTFLWFLCLGEVSPFGCINCQVTASVATDNCRFSIGPNSLYPSQTYCISAFHRGYASLSLLILPHQSLSQRTLMKIVFHSLLRRVPANWRE